MFSHSAWQSQWGIADRSSAQASRSGLRQKVTESLSLRKPAERRPALPTLRRGSDPVSPKLDVKTNILREIGTGTAQGWRLVACARDNHAVERGFECVGKGVDLGGREDRRVGYGTGECGAVEDGHRWLLQRRVEGNNAGECSSYGPADGLGGDDAHAQGSRVRIGGRKLLI